MEVPRCACLYIKDIYRCRHQSGLWQVRDCVGTFQQLMRIYNGREEGLPYRQPDSCTPAVGQNVLFRYRTQLCRDCDAEVRRGWRYMGTRRDWCN